MVQPQPIPTQSTLSFKVLRLTAPSLMTPTTIPDCPYDSDSLLDSLRNPVSSIRDKPRDPDHEIDVGVADKEIERHTLLNIGNDPNLPDLVLGELLVLPQSFGKIYLGETFTSYVSIENTSNLICHNFVLMAEIQTKTRTITLPSCPPRSKLEFNQRVDHIFNYEIKEIGKHVLICSLEYTDDKGKQSFKKQYRFEVKVPLSVTHDFQSSKNNSALYLKADVSNLTSQPMYINDMKLLQCTQFQVVPLNQKENGLSVFSCKDYLNILEKRVYLYKLIPLNTIEVKKTIDIGRLDIVWSSNLGDKGHLQTSALDYENKNFGIIKVKCDISNNDDIAVGEEFNINIVISNCSNDDIKIVLELMDSDENGLLWSGMSSHSMHLPSLQDTSVPLQLTSFRTGIQIINGITITNVKTMERYEFKDIGHILIHNKKDD